MTEGNGKASPPTLTAFVANPCMMPSLLPPTKVMDTTAANTWQAWRKRITKLELLVMATHLLQQPSNVQAAAFLVCVGYESRRVYNTFIFDNGEDNSKLEVVR